MTLTCTTKTCRKVPFSAGKRSGGLPAGGTGCQRGFTLIEILIVTVILATAAALVGTNFADRGDVEALRVEATRLARLVELAREEAVLTGREWGLVIGLHSYQFVVYEADFDRYQPAKASHFRRRVLEDLTFRLNQSGIAAAAQADSGKPRAQIWLLSSGECTPFRLQIADAYGHSIWVESDGFNAAYPNQDSLL